LKCAFKKPCRWNKNRTLEKYEERRNKEQIKEEEEEEEEESKIVR
jgi:hypothetical protein